jgi:hypothetical protein
VDINPSKGKFTWSNKRIGLGNIATRMDHFLVHSNILSQDFLISSKIIPFVNFYHKPIFLFLEDSPDYGPLPFIFKPLWCLKMKK